MEDYGYSRLEQKGEFWYAIKCNKEKGGFYC